MEPTTKSPPRSPLRGYAPLADDAATDERLDLPAGIRHPRHTVLSEQRREFVQGEVSTEITRLMGKPSQQTLPVVARDLPRLIKGIRLMRNGEIPEIIFHEDSSQPRVLQVKQFIVSAARVLDGERVAAFVATKLEENLEDDTTDEGIVSGLSRFFEQGKLEESKWKFISVLKCINQEVIYPGVVTLRRAIYYDSDGNEKFPFHDSKNTWRVRVVADQDSCVVIHSKWEESREGVFRFHWFIELKVEFATGAAYGQVRIANYSFHDAVTNEQRTMILNALRPFLTPTADFETIWSKHATPTALGHELVALTSSLTICNQAGVQLYHQEHALAPNTRAKLILNTLCSVVEPSFIPKLDLLFAEFVKAEGDLAEQLARVFAHIDAQSQLLRLFRLLSSDQLSPCVLRMKRVVSPVVGFRSEKKSHRVHVMFVLQDVAPPQLNNTGPASGRMLPPLSNPSKNVDASASRLNYVVVTHRKRELSMRSSATDVFRFEWVLTLKSRGALEEMLSSDFRVTNVEFEKDTRPELREQVKEILLPYLAPKQIVDTLFSTSIDEILASLIESTPYSTQCYRPAWPFSIPAVDLLQRLRSELKKNGDLSSTKFVW